MFVNFGAGKCPLCGDFGNRIIAGKNIQQKKNGKGNEHFNCRNCRVQFDNYYLFLTEEPKDQNRFWN